MNRFEFQALVDIGDTVIIQGVKKVFKGFGKCPHKEYNTKNRSEVSEICSRCKGYIFDACTTTYEGELSGNIRIEKKAALENELFEL